MTAPAYLNAPARSAEDPDEVREGAASCATLTELDAQIVGCHACPRLVAWRTQVAKEKRAAFRDQPYWGRPTPGFGPSDARIGIIGLAPAAHGGNRTGRIFTGDRSGDWLFSALYRAGLANQPQSLSVDDGLTLVGTRVFASVRCAPPDNRPSPSERDSCAPWLARELELLRPSLRVIVALGAFGWGALFRVLPTIGVPVPRPRPQFGHGVQARLTDELSVVGCYHVSQQNTFTGRLTERMLDDIFARAIRLAHPFG